jgi:hypothetical protein
MIIRRDRSGGEECIRQHDHAAISGALAAAWRVGGPPDDDVRTAVALHDVAWVALDRRARLGAHGRPYSFLDHPLEDKYRAHRAGVDLIGIGSAYAAYLCSRHYARFASLLDDEGSRAYAAAERQRQERLWDELTADQHRRAEADLALLQLLDALSLFVCCNPPGEVTWPFHRNGFSFGDLHLTAAWEGPDTVRLDPVPIAEPLTCRYRTYRWDRSGRLVDPVRHEVRFVV